jgi:hypothetical protein
MEAASFRISRAQGRGTVRLQRDIEIQGREVSTE